MTVEELTDYFANATLPDELRLDRASTQHQVKDHVARLLDNMKKYPENWRHEYQLTRIKSALENPYQGPEIPRY